MAKFILADENMEANSDAANPLNFAGKNLGKCVFAAPDNQKDYLMNPTTPVGGTSGMAISVFFEAKKDGWTVFKAFESYYCPVSFITYYHYTQEQKEKLGNKIRESLDMIRKDVEEYNSMEAKLSKYDMELKNLNNLDSSNTSSKEEAQFYFKHMFINEIDFFSGSIQKEEGKSSLVHLQKNSFPTIIEDFLILTLSSQLKTSDYFKNIPVVEKNLLKSKLFAYDEWMKIYESTLKSRHEQYGQIKRSKEFIIDQTKKSLKPYITQYKLYEEALSSSSARKGLFSDYLISRGLAEPFIVYRIDYFIKSVTDMYQIMAPKQFTREDEMNGVFGKYGCYDKFMKEELIFNFDHGLICDFPWITEEWVEEKVQEITKSHYWNSDRTYFTFHKLKTQRAVAELPMGGGNIMNEDTDFTHTMFLMSRNVFVSKMLELKAKEEEVEHYVDKMLGIIPKVKGKKIIKYEKKRGTEYLVDGKVYDSKKKMIEVYSLDEYTLMEYKTPSKLIAQIKEILYINFKIRAIGGPYEHHFYKGINKTFFKGYVQARFNTICGMFLRRIDVEGKITPLEPRDGQKIFQTQIDSL